MLREIKAAEYELTHVRLPCAELARYVAQARGIGIGPDYRHLGGGSCGHVYLCTSQLVGRVVRGEDGLV